LWRRRFNQSALLAQAIARDSKRSSAPLWLERIKPTRAQVGLDHDARRKNVRRAFAVPEWARSEISGRRILLVDDVMTTGDTAAAPCRRSSSVPSMSAAATICTISSAAEVSIRCSPGLLLELLCRPGAAAVRPRHGEESRRRDSAHSRCG